MDKEYNLIKALRIILKWRVSILLFILAAAIGSAFYSVVLMDYCYLSWATFYPSNQSASDRSAIFTFQTANKVEYFGDKADLNRVLTIANSGPIINFAVDSFRLVAHYKVDTNKRSWRTTLLKKFKKNYKAIKTEREAVEISLYDTDPQLAAAMVNAIVGQIDGLNRVYISQSKQKIYEAVRIQRAKLQSEVNAYADTLAELGQKYNIKVSSGSKGTIQVDGADYQAVQLYKTIAGSQYNTLHELNNLENLEGQMEVSLNDNETSLYIFENAVPADSSDWLPHILVVLFTILIAAFLSVFGVLIIELIREMKGQL